MAVDTHPIDSLRPRERKVLRLIAEGKTNPEIARELGITFETAKWHVSEVLQTLQVSSREEAAREWRRYRRLPARLRRSLAAFPTAWKWIGASGAAAALAIVAAVFVLAYPGDGEADSNSALEPGVYVAYIREYGGVLEPGGGADQPALSVESAPVQVVNVRSGETFTVGEPRPYRAVQWSPNGKRIAALVLTGQPDVFHLWLLDVPGGPDRPLGIVPNEPRFPFADDLRMPFNASPELAWSAGGDFLAVSSARGLAIYDAEGDLVRPAAPVCPEQASGNLSWSPGAGTLVQPCHSGFGVLEGPRAEPVLVSYADAGLPLAGTPLVGGWIDPEAALYMDPRGSGDRGYELSLSEGLAPRIERIEQVPEERRTRALGRPVPDDRYGGQVTDAQLQAAYGLVWSHFMPGADGDSWLGGYPGNAIWSADGPEKLIIRAAGQITVLHLDATWQIGETGGLKRPAGGRAQHGPVAHLLVVD